MTNKHTIGLNEQNYIDLRKGAEQRGTSMQGLMNSLIGQIGIADNDDKIILSVPKSLTSKNKDELRRWLEERIKILVEIYYPDKSEVCSVLDSCIE